MTTAMQTFTNEDFGEIRTVLIDGEPWFVAADVCRALEIKNPRDAVSRLDEDEKSTTVLLDRASTNGVTNSVGSTDGDNNATFGWLENRVNIVNEPGLYRLIFSSRKPEAKQFQHWLYHDVLPTLRKTGKYEIQSTAPTPLADAVTDVRKTADAIQAEFIGVQRSIAFLKAVDIAEEIYDMPLNKLKELVPPAQHDTGFLNPTQIGERLGGIKPRVVNLMLAEAGLQYKVDKNWRLTEKGKGFGEEFPYTRNGHSGWQIKWNADVMNAFKVETAELLKGEISNDDSNADFHQ